MSGATAATSGGAAERLLIVRLPLQTLARDRVLLKGLRRLGHEVAERLLPSTERGRHLRVASELWGLGRRYDAVLIGYGCPSGAIIAGLTSAARVVFNAAHSMYEAVVLDRQACPEDSARAWLARLKDSLAFRSSDQVLVESESQREFLARGFGVRRDKLVVSYTGADDEEFHPDPAVPKREVFTAVFRGGFLPATGVQHVVEAARLLARDDVRVLILGRGMLEADLRAQVERQAVRNVEIVTEFLSPEELRRTMLSCHVCLGQFSAHPRLERTIQNKTFEALALGLPYVTMGSRSNREILTDGVTCLFVPPGDPEALAERIRELKRDADLRERLGDEGHRLYEQRFRPEAIARSFVDAVLRGPGYPPQSLRTSLNSPTISRTPAR